METTRIIRGSTQELQTIYRMKNEPIISTGGSSIPNPQPKTTERYREAVELYRSTRLSCCEISRTCSVSLSGLKGHICKYHRHLKVQTGDDGNTDPAGFDRQDLVDLLTLKTAFKLLADLLEQMNIHLVIQETIHFQYISCSYDSIFTDSVV